MNCTLWPCTLIAATMFLTWSLVLHRSCQLLEMRWQLYRTYAFFCRVLPNAYRYFKTIVMVKINHNTLPAGNSQEVGKNSDDETINLFFEESDEDNRSVEQDYSEIRA